MPETLKLGLKLFVISAVAALALAVTNEVTKGPIKQQEIAATNAARFAVFADADSFSENSAENGIEIYNALDASGNVIGYTGKTLVTGYGGEIEVTVGLQKDGVITAINVGGTNFSETAGLGAKTKDPEFTDQFKGFDAKDTSVIAIGKDGGKVDQVTGASISSRAVTGGVKAIAEAILAIAE